MSGAKQGRDRGIALLAVISVLTVLSLLSVAALDISRTAVLHARRAGEIMRAEAELDGAFWQSAFLLLESAGALDPAFTPAGRLQNGESGTIMVRIRAEAGKVDLNTGDEAAIAALFRAAGLDDGRAAALAAAVADWRDADDLRRLNGAERRDYAAAGLRDMPPNRPFADILELARVLGVTSDMLACALEDSTLYSQLLAPRPDLASPPLARALGHSGERGEPFHPVPGDTIAVDVRMLDEEGTARFARRWVLRLTGNRTDPLHILERRDWGPMLAAATHCPGGRP